MPDRAACAGRWSKMRAPFGQRRDACRDTLRCLYVCQFGY
ncbi:hypothetical protein BURMUCGD1_6222 [Burkholderia multivorans CGD1]|nr:hypothetical protein BURMUCGD1_6222 [Burkholderia multivorans CGD1]